MGARFDECDRWRHEPFAVVRLCKAKLPMIEQGEGKKRANDCGDSYDSHHDGDYSITSHHLLNPEAISAVVALASRAIAFAR